METAVTLAQSMETEAVGFDQLEADYRPVLGLVKELLGVVPNCDPYLEIWPPSFRAYNLMVPSFLNLPVVLFGRGAPKSLVGLAMYEASRAAECNYCSAHTCTFALRRGASADAVSGARRGPVEQAVVELARSLSTVPASYSAAHRAEVERHLGAANTEWIGLGIAMMGFLNKFMDALGVNLEPDAIADVQHLIGPTGWTVGNHGWALTDEEHDLAPATPPQDSLAMFARVVRLAPGAVRLERKWMRGIPTKQVASRQYLVSEFGFDESLITRISHRKPAVTLAAMLAENLRPAHSAIGLAAKAQITNAFAEVVDSDHLRAHAVAMAAHHGDAGDHAHLAAILRLANSIAPSPSVLSPAEIVDLRSELDARQTIETISWVSMLQLLHRLDLFQH